MDHHCIWLNTCVGLHNHRYFIQLIFHSSISSIFTLYCLYDLSFSPKYFVSLCMLIFQAMIMGNAYLWIGFHICMSILFGFYTLFHFWILYKDVTTLEFMNLFFTSDKEVPKFARKHFRSSLLLIFGTQSIMKALFYPLLHILPINGLEYEYDSMQQRVKSYR